ncbi:TATA box-binding protein-associated factor RNA polymerase I subunit B isoform X2 [Thamnophis elegans]|uniref:TATA box-binding protein-associated factor RNA polymerase I subunit B isoform X2 n=1 Tax=Thamnophis elegans TaxID=35005 RepID=UPI0013767930|nr:TATA box-binding protein-associated factor RNA polymerase I subunit B isoform X2 [Thamnophis elegans]
MEEEDARDYNEPCGYCSAVSWSVTEEGRFYCTSCHTVIEKTREVQTGDVITNARAQSISRGLRKRKNKFDKGWEWFICEGFQYILRKQAEALQSLGVSSQIKDEVLYNFWRRYLHKSKQGYGDKPLSDVSHDISSHTDTETEVESTSPIKLISSRSDIDVISEFSAAASSSVSKASAKSGWSGSVDGGSYLQKKKKGDLSLSMPLTLAFCSLALLWLRESITLADLLRLVMDDHIPYLNAFKEFPEEMKMYGSDFKIFRVQSWPKYEDIYKKMHALADFIDLPCFPDITEGSFLHPNILCMKYMMEINLPDEMNKWTCKVIKKIGVGETDFLTLHPGNKSTWKVKYDILAVAIIIVVLKILFLLDDEYEWLLANYTEERNKKNEEGCQIFDIRKWYMVVKNILDVEQKKYNEERIRRLWRCEKPLLYSASEKYVVLKKKQMVMDLQRQFRTLTGCLELTEKRKLSLFQFNWTEESTKKDCFHSHSLGAFLQQKGDIFTPLNRDYWLCSVKKCKRISSLDTSKAWTSHRGEQIFHRLPTIVAPEKSKM